MIRKALISFIFLAVATAVNAQVAKWMIKPEYDSITVNEVGLLEVTKDGKVGLCGRDGSVLLDAEYDSIGEFREGYAVLYKDGIFAAIYSVERGLVNLEQNHVALLHLREGCEFFSCGRLLVYISVGGRQGYGYMDTDGVINYGSGPYADAYLYSEGYAVVKRYSDNQTTMPWDMIDVNGRSVDFGGERKSNIAFLSSFRNNSAIMVIRNRFYDISTDNFTPQQRYIDSVESRRSMIVTDPNISTFQPQSNGTLLVRARNNVGFVFDKDLRLIRYSYNPDHEEIIEDEPELPRELSEPLFSGFEEGGLHGLNYQGELLLPAQFESVLYAEEHFAIVELNGKVGVIEADANAEIKFIINSNTTITFRHQNRNDINIDVELPIFINEASLYSDDIDLLINNRTQQLTTGITGKFINCSCIVDIPSEIDQDNLRSPHIYHFHIEYDGLRSKVYEVSVIEYYDKYYSVEMETKSLENIMHGQEVKIEFEVVEINPERDSQSYPKEVVVYVNRPDGSQEMIVPESINNIRYAFYIDVNEREIDFDIDITEEGCPTIRYPYNAYLELPEVEVGDEETPVEPQPATLRVTEVRATPQPPLPTLDIEEFDSEELSTATIEKVDIMGQSSK